jgi:hypothetical protein
MFLKITISVSKYKLLVWFETDATKLPRQHHTHTQSERVLTYTPKKKTKAGSPNHLAECDMQEEYNWVQC